MGLSKDSEAASGDLVNTGHSQILPKSDRSLQMHCVPKNALNKDVTYTLML